MKSSLLLCILFSVWFLFSTSQAYASSGVVINEFMVNPSDGGQWVELYNNGTEAVNIGGWILDDNGSLSQKFTIPDGTTIAPGEYIVFESSFFNFNTASADRASLLQGSVVIDMYEYATAPGRNNALGRQNDGSSTWVTFGSATKGSSNDPSPPLPTPTFTPTPTDKPSPTTKPTVIPKSPTPKKPTPIKSAITPTKKPTPIKSSSTPTQKPTAMTTLSLTSNKEQKKSFVASNGAYPTMVLGTMSAKKKAEAPSPSQTVMVKDAQGENIMPVAVAIVVGIGSVLACGIIVFLKLKENR